jgi:glucose/arabinose dehydrogenase
MRNPWRLWADPQTGLLWVGDVGEGTREEIAIVRTGEHHGYPFVEGDHAWGDLEGKNCSSLMPSRECSPPVHAYDRSTGRSVTAGLILDGCGWSNVFGGSHYLFADFAARWIQALPVNAARTGVTGPAVSFATSVSSPVSLRVGPDGALYVVSYSIGQVHRYAPVNLTGPGCQQAMSVPATSWHSSWALLGLLIVAGSLLAVRPIQRL